MNRFFFCQFEALSVDYLCWFPEKCREKNKRSLLNCMRTDTLLHANTHH